MIYILRYTIINLTYHFECSVTTQIQMLNVKPLLWMSMIVWAEEMMVLCGTNDLTQNILVDQSTFISTISMVLFLTNHKNYT